VGADYRLSTEDIDFGTMQYPQVPTEPRIVDIVSFSSDSPVLLVAAESNSPRVTARKVNDNSFSVSLSSESPTQVSEVDASIRVTTTSSAMPVILMRATATLCPPFWTSQEMILIDSRDMGTRTENLTVYTAAPSKLSFSLSDGGAADADGITVTTEQAADRISKRHVLSVEIADLGRSYGADLNILLESVKGGETSRSVPIFRFAR
jgi:hypothetical protein